VLLEPSWWSNPDAAEERRALIEAFRVEDLEAATGELRARCAALEHHRTDGEVTVGEVAELLVCQWSVAFQARLADSQRAFYAGDHARLAWAAEDARAAAVAVRDWHLAPQRISRHSLHQALSVANADACVLELDRSEARRSRPPAQPALSEQAEAALAAHEVVSRCRHAAAERDEAGNADDAALGRLAADQVAELIEQLPAGDRAVVRARIAAAERAHTAEAEDRGAGRVLTADRLRQMLPDVVVLRRDRDHGRGISM
jgi:hypothetical protein